ncbi:MAG TPA: RNA 2',3'-cyclic phosphodiesterase [Bryobacteraceae bacterium]|nr:RNA 2',3'-cyclic phosphodiesterase [Bryobacteraceae bacterium]
MRLFTGLDLPEGVSGKLKLVIDRLRPAASIHWTPLENLHITTKFIGEWQGERLDELRSALAAMAPRPPIRVHVRRVGFFPNPHAPHMFWCGIEAPGLAELAADTDRATASLGIASETRAYSPHLTLARIKRRTNLQPLREAIAALDSLDFGSFEANGLFLYQSTPGSNSSVYTKLAEFLFTK